MPENQHLDGFFQSDTLAELRRLLGPGDTTEIFRGLAASVQVARLVADPGAETTRLWQRRTAEGKKVLALMERLRLALAPIEADLRADGMESDMAARIEALRSALTSFERYLRFETFYIPYRRRGPKPDEFRHAFVAFVALSLTVQGFPVSKKRGALLERVLRAIWCDATRGTRPPEDLWHFIKPAVDQVRRGRAEAARRRAAKAGGVNRQA